MAVQSCMFSINYAFFYDKSQKKKKKWGGGRILSKIGGIIKIWRIEQNGGGG